MIRTLAFAAVLILPSFAAAQVFGGGSRSGGVGGGIRLNNAPAVSGVPLNLGPARFSVGGGAVGGYHPGYSLRGTRGMWSSYYGNYYGLGYYDFANGYGYGTPYFVQPLAVPVPVEVPVFVEAQPRQPAIELSGEAAAVLVMEFPAVAEVWVNGKKGEGDPIREWTLTSPILKAGAEYTFDVKARWKAGGKTFEYERSVTVAGGRRSRSLVIGGTEVKE